MAAATTVAVVQRKKTEAEVVAVDAIDSVLDSRDARLERPCVSLNS